MAKSKIYNRAGERRSKLTKFTVDDEATQRKCGVGRLVSVSLYAKVGGIAPDLWGS